VEKAPSLDKRPTPEKLPNADPDLNVFQSMILAEEESRFQNGDVQSTEPKQISSIEIPLQFLIGGSRAKI
jgi:hypothetical protein